MTFRVLAVVVEQYFDICIEFRTVKTLGQQR